MFEITSKIKSDFDKVNELIHRFKNILIVGHRPPDDDAVGSALALKFALRGQGIESSIFIADYSPKKYKFLPGYNLINSKLDNYDFDLVFALDYGDVRRLAIDDLLEQRNPAVITIDHHVDGGTNHIGEVKILEPISSTAEIIYYFLKESGWVIDKDVATCILTGIIYDTGGFLHSNTSHRTLLTVGELLSKGIRINKIIRQVLNTSAFVENSRSLGQLLSRTERHPEIDLVYLVVNNSDFEKWHKSDLKNLVSAINTVGDCRWALILIEYEEGKTKASLRSEEFKGVDVSKIASLFGGGGHKLASGFQVDDKPERVLEQVIEQARKVIV